MIDKVYYISTKSDDENYYKQIIRIIEETEFYDNILEDENVVIKFHLRDFDESKYVDKETLKNIEDNIIKKKQ